MYFLVIGIAMVVAFVLFFGIRFEKQRRIEARNNHDRIEHAKDLLKRATHGEREAEEQLLRLDERGYIDELRTTYLRWMQANLSTFELKLVKEIRTRGLVRRDYEQKSPRIHELNVVWQNAQDSGTFKDKMLAGLCLHEALSKLFYPENRSRICEEVGVVPQAVADDLRDIFREYTDNLWVQARTSKGHYLELRSLLLEVSQGRIFLEANRWSGPRIPSSIDYSRPEGWNEKTAEYLDDPHFKDFEAAEMQPGEAHRRAVELRLNPDWVEAAVIVAYANSYERVRQEVGEQLKNELQEIVVTRRRSLIGEAS